MTHYIEAPTGWVKRAGSQRERKALGIFAEATSCSGPETLASTLFHEASSQFRLGEKRFSGIAIGITEAEGRRSPDTLEGNAVILTLEQAEALASRITEAIAVERRISEKHK